MLCREKESWAREWIVFTAEMTSDFRDGGYRCTNGLHFSASSITQRPHLDNPQSRVRAISVAPYAMSFTQCRMSRFELWLQHGTFTECSQG